MWQSILVPLDGTPEAQEALGLAKVIASASRARIDLLRIVPTFGIAPPGPDPEKMAEAESALKAIADEVGRSGVQVRQIVTAGDPAAEIIETAASQGTDLIVMTSHGRSGLERLVLGSVTEKVIAESPVHVALVRPGGHSPEGVRTLLAPVDGSAGAVLAGRVAATLAKAAGARLVFLRVMEPLPLWLYEPTIGVNTGPLIDPMWNEDARASAETYVAALVRRFNDAGLQAEGEAVVGNASKAIVEAADRYGADLIVMGTHAHRGLTRAIVGSVADEVARTATRPVLLVRQTAAEKDAADAPR